MKKERRADSRVARTKAAIKRAYLYLLGHKDAKAITVTDVAATADVDRKTVYNYYEGASAILEELENELVSLVGKSITENEILSCVSDPQRFLENMHRAFSAHTELTVPLLGQNKHSHVLQKLGDAFSERISVMLSDRVTPQKKPYAKLYADFLTSGIASVYRDWVSAGMQQPLEEIARQISQFLGNGITAFIKA